MLHASSLSDPSKLPAPLTPLVGRQREVAAVCALLGRADVRCLTLTGPGGVGKTRLALEATVAIRHEFADGVRFVPLAPIREPNLVLSTIAKTLGVQEKGSRSVVERLTMFLRGRQLLLLLDNFEQVLPAAPLVVALLTACPGVKVLVTSRAVLHLSGEHDYSVPPLAVPDALAGSSVEQIGDAEAVRLFMLRAEAAKPDFSLTPDTAPAVAAICARLDGLPLAIELAAARTRLLSPPALLARLTHRLTLLTGGMRDQPERLRTMRGAIAWSYDLLNPDEQTSFRRLAVFVGGWTQAAAEAIAGAERAEWGAGQVLDDLSSLLDKSLIRQRPQPDGEPRFGMLETIREFGLEQLAASGKEAAVRQAHADHYLSVVERTDFHARFLPRGDRLLVDLETEHPNLRAALTWLEETNQAELMLRLVGALTPFWNFRGHVREGHDWVQRALKRRYGTSDRAQAKALWGLSVFLHKMGEEQRALELGAEGLALARALNDFQTMFCSLELCGLVAHRRRDFSGATAFEEEALASLRQHGDEPWVQAAISTVLGHLGNIAVSQGDLPRAEARFTEAVECQRALGYEPGTSHMLANHPLAGLGDVARAAGDHARALAHYQEGLTWASSYGDTRAIGYALGGVAGTLAAAGDWALAARLFGAAEALHEVAAHPFGLETFDRQRALGLPEPWMRIEASFGPAQALRDALGDQVAIASSVVGDPEMAAGLWAEGRALPLAGAVAEALAALVPPVPKATAEAATPCGLTVRELEVLRLLADGRSDREIAATLFISHRTVMRHVTGILTKLNVENRTAATNYAVRHNLV